MEGTVPGLPNWRSAVLVERGARKGLISQRTAMLDDSSSRPTAMNRQRTSMMTEYRATRTAMMLPHTLGSEESHAPQSQPTRWSVMRAASGAKSTVQGLLSQGMKGWN